MMIKSTGMKAEHPSSQNVLTICNRKQCGINVVDKDGKVSGFLHLVWQGHDSPSQPHNHQWHG